MGKDMNSLSGLLVPEQEADPDSHGELAGVPGAAGQYTRPSYRGCRNTHARPCHVWKEKKSARLAGRVGKFPVMKRRVSMGRRKQTASRLERMYARKPTMLVVKWTKLVLFLLVPRMELFPQTVPLVGDVREGDEMVDHQHGGGVGLNTQGDILFQIALSGGDVREEGLEEGL